MSTISLALFLRLPDPPQSEAPPPSDSSKRRGHWRADRLNPTELISNLLKSLKETIVQRLTEIRVFYLQIFPTTRILYIMHLCFPLGYLGQTASWGWTSQVPLALSQRCKRIPLNMGFTVSWVGQLCSMPDWCKFVESNLIIPQIQPVGEHPFTSIQR